MSIRETIQAAQVAAMKAGDKPTLAAIRLMLAAIKNCDIEARAPQSKAGKAPGDDDALVVEVLSRMVKQRRESIEMFRAGNRPELAEAEAQEVAAIERFLPQRLSPDETRAAIATIVGELGATGPKDMGRVIAALKERHGTALDMAQASGLVKAALAGG